MISFEEAEELHLFICLFFFPVITKKLLLKLVREAIKKINMTAKNGFWILLVIYSNRLRVAFTGQEARLPCKLEIV